MKKQNNQNEIYQTVVDHYNHKMENEPADIIHYPMLTKDELEIAMNVAMSNSKFDAYYHEQMEHNVGKFLIKMLKAGNISVDDILYHLYRNDSENIISTMIWDLIWENDRQKHRIIELDPEVDQKTKLRSMLKQKTKHLDKEAV